MSPRNLRKLDILHALKEARGSRDIAELSHERQERKLQAITLPPGLIQGLEDYAARLKDELARADRELGRQKFARVQRILERLKLVGREDVVLIDASLATKVSASEAVTSR